MRNFIWILVLFPFMVQSAFSQDVENLASDFVIAFGSCNKQDSPQPYWEEILKNDPDLFIWGGDNIYGDSEDMSKIKNDYKIQNDNLGYQKLKKAVPVIGTWDDHDFGKNDAGVRWKMKKESQQLFLDFLGVSNEDSRRKQEGVYTSQVFETAKGSIKVIILDTRYFRDPLLKDHTGIKRYLPYENNNVTILGAKQWSWLENELKSIRSDFTIIVSSIQFLSGEHGWECWANFPGELERLKKMIVSNEAKNVIVLSGDRHISEFSKIEMSELSYPIIDFTSSGLTHSYSDYKVEPNRYRYGEVVFIPSFGILKFNFDKKTLTMQMRGENNILLQEITQQYPE